LNITRCSSNSKLGGNWRLIKTTADGFPLVVFHHDLMTNFKQDALHQYIKQGGDFQISNVPIGPPIPILGPVQNHESGNWIGETVYSFRVSDWNRIFMMQEYLTAF
jgi:hypothetical protein